MFHNLEYKKCKILRKNTKKTVRCSSCWTRCHRYARRCPRKFYSRSVSQVYTGKSLFAPFNRLRTKPYFWVDLICSSMQDFSTLFCRHGAGDQRSVVFAKKVTMWRNRLAGGGGGSNRTCSALFSRFLLFIAIEVVDASGHSYRIN